MTTRNPCLNVPTTTYGGKEKSPLGRGLSAEGYEIGTKLEGCDNIIWMTKVKNGKKVWVRTNLENDTVDLVNVIKDDVIKTSDEPVE